MKCLSFAILLAASSTFAGNYIDNPNFDLKRKGWAGHDVEIVSYQESIRQQRIADQYFSYRKEAQYLMKQVPNEVPLHFTVELSYECGRDDSGEIEIELGEVSYGSMPSAGYVVGGGMFGFSVYVPAATGPVWHLSTLSKKRVSLFGCDRWHVVSADYPVYKKSEETHLLIAIRSQRIDSRVYLGYAQVGTDPRNLGGRGARERSM